MVYLHRYTKSPTNVDFLKKNNLVGQYTVRPMDPIGFKVQKQFAKQKKPKTFIVTPDFGFLFEHGVGLGFKAFPVKS